MSEWNSLEVAKERDANDPLGKYRNQFHIPLDNQGREHIYLCGNSLGLMPKMARERVNEELDDWAKYGVEGHLHARHPWLPYHEFLTEQMAAVVGALPGEVVVMNGLTANLHLMMVSFYRPTSKRHKIMIDYSPFPSDRYAVESQIKFHGFDPSESIIELQPSNGSEIVDTADILKIIEQEGEEIALVMIGGVNYYTGQYYDVKSITHAGHEQGCAVGFDMAHGAGNIRLNLHGDGPDFAVWCTYKYLNSGPGSLSGCFVHNRHANNPDLPRFSGWWGHDKTTRFLMGDDFVPIEGAEGWQLSNPPILSMAAIRASLEIFHEVGMEAIEEKSKTLTAYTEKLLIDMGNSRIKVITPTDPNQRGCQLSIQVQDADKSVFDAIAADGVIADWREPDVIRIAPVPLYNSYVDVWNFVNILKKNL